MGSSGKGNTPSPQVVPGFEFLSPQIEHLTAQGVGGIQRVNNQAFGGTGKFDAGPNIGRAQGTEGELLRALQGALGGFGEGVAALQSGAQGGFFPQYLDQAQTALMGANERNFQRGQAQIYETNSALGIPLTSSTTAQNVADLSGNLGASVNQGIANIIAGAAPAAISAQLGSAGALSQLPGQTANVLAGPLGRAFAQQQAQQQVPFQTLAGGAQLLGQLPVYNPPPQQGKDLGAILGLVGAGVGTAFAGPAGGAAGGAIGTGLGSALS